MYNKMGILAQVIKHTLEDVDLRSFKPKFLDVLPHNPTKGGEDLGSLFI